MALEFVAGCLGGCAGVAVGHPFDTVKVKLQTQDAFNPRYKGTWHCLAETMKQDSIRGLYRGMSSPMAGVAFVNAIIFGVHGNIMKKVDNPDLLRSHLLAGSAAGFLQSFIACPMELAKTRMQIMSEMSSSSKALYKNPIDCLSKMYKTEGIRGLFRGQTITVMREIPGFGMYFLSYEWMVRKLCPDGQVNGMAVLVAGGMAGIASWVTCYPMDVLKSRIQADGMVGAAKYKGILDCLKKSVKMEGWSVLTRGLSTTVIRAFPTNAATFAVVNWTMDFFQKAEEETETGIVAWKEFKNFSDGILESSATNLTLNQYATLSLVNCTPPGAFSVNINTTSSDLYVPLTEVINTQTVESNKCLGDESKGWSEGHECESSHNTEHKHSRVQHIVTDVNFCQICGRCMKRGAQLIFNTSNSLKCMALRQQTLSNAL